MEPIEKPHRLISLLPWLPPVLMGPVAGVFLARVMFELWPTMTGRVALAAWPGTIGAAAVGLLIALGLRWIGLRVIHSHVWSFYLLGRRGRNSSSSREEGQPDHLSSSAFLPYSLLLVYILWPRTNLLMAGVLLAGAVGLSLAIGLRALVPASWRWALWRVLPVTLAVVVLTAYLQTVGRTVGAADTFEFQVVAPHLGIAHPTGYPLFLLIGKLFSLIPFGLMAWRVNLVSVTFATLASIFVYFTLHRLTGQRAISLLAALCLAFSQVFWSQATEAEVYPLNAAFVAVILWWVASLENSPTSRRWLFALAAMYGLSFTNHLTMVILAPAIVLAVWLARPPMRRQDWLLAMGCFLAPLLIDLYMPLRWPAVHNGQWMSLGDFIAYITGHQFGGALQLGLWRDPTRWRIVGGLMLEVFSPIGAVLAMIGLAGLAVRRWKVAVTTFIAWVGYIFYGLVYNVPDVSVFILPAHIIMAVWIGVAVAQLTSWIAYRTSWVRELAWVAFSLLPLSLLWANGPLVDQSEVGWDLYRWGRYVMELPMPTGSAILADSEKIAPLYYLKRIENVRPDVDTLVLGDEGLYRAELDRRVAAGQPVYLARYLPGIAGLYRLHSLGPLVRVTTKPTTTPPSMQKQLNNVNWGGGKIALLGLDVEPGQDDVAWRITLYWLARTKLDENYHVRLRWVGPSGEVWWQDHGAHPVGGYDPTTAWLPGEIVADYHEIPADATIPPGLLRLDVGLFLPFRDDGLDRDGTTSPWFTLVLLDQVSPQSVSRAGLTHALRASFGDELLITGTSDPGVLPPSEPVSVLFEWSRIKSFDGDLGPGLDNTLQLRWTDARGAEIEIRYLDSTPLQVGSLEENRVLSVKPYAGEYPTSQWPLGRSLMSRVTIPSPSTPGIYTLRAGWVDSEGRELVARCAWLAPVSSDCAVGTLRVEGTARGQGINFDNQVLLQDAQISRAEMRPNETLDVKLKWQGLRQWNANYTAFVHLLGPDGKVNGQVDQWPLDGTLATSDWSPGRVIDDPYHVPLTGDAPPGIYQVEVGWYLLATMRRLPVVDAQGRPVDNRVIVGTVTVQP